MRLRNQKNGVLHIWTKNNDANNTFWLDGINNRRAHLAVKALGQSICTGAWNGCDVNQGGKTQMYSALQCTVYVHPKTLTQRARAYFYTNTWQHKYAYISQVSNHKWAQLHLQVHTRLERIYLEEKSPDQPVGSENSFLQSKVACSSEGVKCPLWRDNLKFFKPMLNLVKFQCQLLPKEWELVIWGGATFHIVTGGTQPLKQEDHES